MNANAKRLVNALRSDRFRQAKGRLAVIDAHGNESFCCLGVACEIYREANPDFPRILEGGKDAQQYRYGHEGIHGSSAVMPDKVAAFFGFKEEGGQFTLGKNQSGLAGLNDGGLDFRHIADIIESEPEGLFISE